MNVKPRGTVTLPRSASSGVSLLPWCKEVNRALQQTRDRTIFVPASGGRSSSRGITPGAFYKLLTIASEDATNGDIYLQGGQISAGTGNETIANFLLYDASATTWAGSAGEHLQIAIAGTGSEEDDVLMPTFDSTGATGPTVVSTIADNTLPTVSSLTGTCNISLGVFGAAGFNPANSGNIRIGFCFGGFTIARF